MEITVLLEPQEGHRYRASSGPPLATEAEGTSREEALCNLRAQIENKIRSGAEILTLEVGTPAHPWTRFAGTLKDDPLGEAWVQAMAAYRASVDNDPNAP
jgi:hypothetical protein